MSRGKSTPEGGEAEAAGKLLRELAERAEHDPAFGRQLADAVRASGLLEVMPSPAPARKQPARGPKPKSAPDQTVPDPFQVLRQHGEDALRSHLAQLDLAALRQIVRAHRLDPARISAHWTASDRIVALIVDQVRARANHGRAFERI